MSKKLSDIDDNEIRIISASEPDKEQRHKRFLRVYLPSIIAVLVLAVVGFWYLPGSDEPEKAAVSEVMEPQEVLQLIVPESVPAPKGYTVARDTTINGCGLLFLTPENARPRLIIGTEQLNDSSIVLATQAADVRGDNGQIAGTFVLDGQLLSKGEAKAGFCSIIKGELTIGVADATPMLEQALTDDGFFFRQYPLVVGGQIVENKPKGRAVRKALAEIGGRTCVVVSKDKLTFHDFSQLLIDAGARNAIYLVGSASYGFYVNKQGSRIPLGKKPWTEVENVSYIVWE